MKRAVFLDRDGVINRAIVRNGKPYPPTTIAEFEYLPGVEASLRALRSAGFLAIVVTNQPDVATGIQRQEVVEAMHSKIVADNLCDDICVCYHTDADRCDCRKPRPGMLTAAASKWGIELQSSFMIGDRWRDVAAGKAAGCFTFFLDYQYVEKAAEEPDAVVASLEEAVVHILRKSRLTTGTKE